MISSHLDFAAAAMAQVIGGVRMMLRLPRVCPSCACPWKCARPMSAAGRLGRAPVAKRPVLCRNRPMLP